MISDDNSTESTLDEYALPPRTVVHPSSKGKLTRWFYSTIVTLFILLILTLIGLFLYSSTE